MEEVFKFFSKEMCNNPELYTDSQSNTVNYTKLAEAYLTEKNIEIESEEENTVFEAVIDWFLQWEGRYFFNNN